MQSFRIVERMSSTVRYPLPQPIIELVRPSRIITPVEVAVVVEDIPEGQILTNLNLISVP